MVSEEFIHMDVYIYIGNAGATLTKDLNKVMTNGE